MYRLFQKKIKGTVTVQYNYVEISVLMINI